MKPRLCSYDLAAVPDDAFVLNDTGGEMYFCDLRCLCIWSVALATRPELPETVKKGTYVLKTGGGNQHQFIGIAPIARWALEGALTK